MLTEINYPTAEKIVELNILAITLIKVKKSDAAKVLSVSKIKEVLEDCETNNGDIYDKAIILLKGIIQKHPFASGNRRTALITMIYFMIRNHTKIGFKDDLSYVKIMRGIREHYYSDQELKEWIKYGKIRDFKR